MNSRQDEAGRGFLPEASKPTKVPRDHPRASTGTARALTGPYGWAPRDHGTITGCHHGTVTGPRDHTGWLHGTTGLTDHGTHGIYGSYGTGHGTPRDATGPRDATDPCSWALCSCSEAPVCLGELAAELGWDTTGRFVAAARRPCASRSSRWSCVGAPLGAL